MNPISTPMQPEQLVIEFAKELIKNKEIMLNDLERRINRLTESFLSSPELISSLHVFCLTLLNLVDTEATPELIFSRLLLKSHPQTQTALQFVLASGNIAAAQWIKDKFIGREELFLEQLKSKNDRGETPFISALLGGHLNSADWIVAQFKELKREELTIEQLNSKYNIFYSYTPLQMFLQNGQLDRANWIVNQIKKQQKDFIGQLQDPYYYNRTPLYCALISGKVKVADWIVKHLEANNLDSFIEEELFRFDGDGHTSLHRAFNGRNLESIVWIFNRFKEKKVSAKRLFQLFSSSDLYHNPIFHAALGSGFVDCFKVVFADISSIEGAIIKLLRIKDSKGRTPLLYAAAEANHQTLKWILELGIALKDDVFFQEFIKEMDNRKENLLHHVMIRESHHSEYLKLIFDYISKQQREEFLLASNNSGTTPLEVYLINNEANSVKELLKAIQVKDPSVEEEVAAAEAMFCQGKGFESMSCWWNSALEGDQSERYLEVALCSPELARYALNDGKEVVFRKILEKRSNLTNDEVLAFLPCFLPSEIVAIVQKWSVEEKKYLLSQKIFFEEEEECVSEMIKIVYRNKLNPQQIILDPESISLSIGSFLGVLSFAELATAAFDPDLTSMLCAYLPFTTESQRAVIIPLLTQENFLKLITPLNARERSNYLAFATFEQKKLFITENFLLPSSLQTWEKRSGWYLNTIKEVKQEKDPKKREEFLEKLEVNVNLIRSLLANRQIIALEQTLTIRALNIRESYPEFDACIVKEEQKLEEIWNQVIAINNEIIELFESFQPEPPEDIVDPITCAVIKDPIVLPSSNVIVDRSTLKRLFKETIGCYKDPYTNGEFKAEEVKAPSREIFKTLNKWKHQRTG